MTTPDGARDDPMTAPRFAACKGGEPLVVLTAYDFPTARLFERAGVDALLVGDSLGTAVAGRDTTLSVTMDQMVYHTEMVARACSRALVVADMPFLSYQASTEEAVRNAGRLVQQGGADAVKLEGGRRNERAIDAIVAGAHLPVMGHIGLTPQSIRRLGRYRVERAEEELIEEARAVERAGCFAVVLEAIPATVAERITHELTIPTIGIGAGPACDGQVLVWQDAFGLTEGFVPKFVRPFANLAETLAEGAAAYRDAVRDRSFPGPEQSYR